MKKLVLIVTLVFAAFSYAKSQSEAQLVEICAAQAGDDATYLKDFIADLPSASPDGRPPEAKFSMVLSSSTIYRFSICNSESKPGKGIIQLYDTNKLLGSSYNAATGKEYDSFNFHCNKTGVYHVFIKFQDGKEGYAVGILSFVKKL